MQYLNNKQFFAKFKELWDNSQTELFKLEMLPEYLEFQDGNWNDVDSFQCAEIIEKAQKDGHDWLKNDSAKFAAGFKATRVRYLPFPLTKYLLLELSTYATTQPLGVEVFILEDKQLKTVKDKVKLQFRDFLLFDERALLILDNPNGLVECHAWFTEDKAEIAPYIGAKKALLPLTQPLDDYMARMNLQFIKTKPE